MKLNEEQIKGLGRLHKFYQGIQGKFYGDTIEWEDGKVRFKSALKFIEELLNEGDFKVDDNERKYLNTLRDIALHPPLKKMV